MPKVGRTQRQAKATKGIDGYCRKCQTTKALANFYEATNPMIDTSGFMSVCKQCCSDLYWDYFTIYNNIEDAIRLTCESLDIRFSKEALKQTQSHIEGLISKGKKADAVFGYYKSKLSSTGKNNDGVDSLRYKDSDNVKNTTIDNILTTLDDEVVTDNVDSDFVLTGEVLSFWGKGFNKNEYEYLQNFFQDFINNYECDSPTQLLLFKNAAKTQLHADKALSEGNVTLYNTLMKTLSSILGDSNIKPVQETGANATDQATFGTLLKKWENEEPVPEPLEEWKDKDWISKYVLVWFFGHLCKMLNIQNDYTELYESEILKHTVDMPNEDDGDE